MAGLYTMNLVVALFVAILLLNLEGFLDLGKQACIASASLIHLSWLAAFFWMATLSFNVAKTFVGTAFHRGTGNSYRKLLAVMGLVWGGALLIVSTCLVLSVCRCTSLPAIYSEASPCLIASGNVLLVVFGGPVAISLLFSITCFALIVNSVRKAKSDSKMVQNKGQIKEMLNEAKIYAKLAFIFGLTWVIAFAAEAVNHVILNYINVILNTSQGVFIFLAFAINQRTRALWRKRLPCFAKTKTGSSLGSGSSFQTSKKCTVTEMDGASRKATASPETKM
ncbi:G-protein coupled receptor Mth-like [Patiria miniata]|uniref:G-protein coupled receptors family 2 profile 2 domain-containing protein n=1 Tax=Patiria miniata TaxID=46514 RepID=A0A913ZJ77_PATMI|nr:G-protein coupled receptor Mth-like [Patiria miniata]